MNGVRNPWLTAIGMVVPVTIVVGDLFGGVLALVVAATLAVVGFRTVRGFLRLVLTGALAGAVAGVLVLGPGFRLVMRVVAIADPAQTPEFSVGGTMFLIVGFGGIFGAVTGISGTLIARGLQLSRSLGAAVYALPIVALLLQSPDLRAELFEFGLGVWMNLPLFVAVSVGYGWMADRFATRRARHERSDVAAVQTAGVA